MQKQYTLEHEIRLLDEQKAVKQKELEKLREKQKENEAYKATTYIGAKFIIVPYEQKDIAKKMGAMWCPNKKYWYIPADVEREPFLKRWKLLKIKCKNCTNSNDDCYCGCPSGRTGCVDCENPELCGWCNMCDRMN